MSFSKECRNADATLTLRHSKAFKKCHFIGEGFCTYSLLKSSPKNTAREVYFRKQIYLIFIAYTELFHLKTSKFKLSYKCNLSVQTIPITPKCILLATQTISVLSI